MGNSDSLRDVGDEIGELVEAFAWVWKMREISRRQNCFLSFI